MRTTRLSTLIGSVVLAKLLWAYPAFAQPGVDQPLPMPEEKLATGDEVVEDNPFAEKPSSRPVPTRAFLRHIPPALAKSGAKLEIMALIDSAWVEGGLILYHRAHGQSEYQQAEFRRSSAGGYVAVVPGEQVGRAGVEYFIMGQEPNNLHFASAQHPHRVRVEPKESDRWKETERKRLANRNYSFDSSLTYYNFGSESGRDRFVRGHIDWGHLLVDDIYSIKLGFAFLQGATPEEFGVESMASSKEGARYGYGGVRLRLADKFWLDTKAMMGFGKDGFVAGLGGQVIIGNDWRTAVMVGGEIIGELSYRAWATLQWDTVPGVLMSSTVATTNQPDAKIDAGSYVEFRVKVPVLPTLEVSFVGNYAARGNRPGGFGGGLETAYRF